MRTFTFEVFDAKGNKVREERGLSKFSIIRKFSLKETQDGYYVKLHPKCKIFNK